MHNYNAQIHVWCHVWCSSFFSAGGTRQPCDCSVCVCSQWTSECPTFTRQEPVEQRTTSRSHAESQVPWTELEGSCYKIWHTQEYVLRSLKGVSSKRCSTVFTRDEERKIVLTCQILAEMGFLLTKRYFEVVVTDYLKNQNHTSSFRPSGVPGRSWWEVFFTWMAYTSSTKGCNT